MEVAAQVPAPSVRAVPRVPVGMVGRGLGLAHHDHRPSDVRSTSIGVSYSAAQGLRGDDLLRRPADRAAPGHVDHPVEVGDDRIDVVGHDQDGDPVLGC